MSIFKRMRQWEKEIKKKIKKKLNVKSYDGLAINGVATEHTE